MKPENEFFSFKGSVTYSNCHFVKAYMSPVRRINYGRHIPISLLRNDLLKVVTD